MYPEGLKYNEEHTWLKLEGEGLGRVGITTYAQEQLKEVVFVELPEIGTAVSHMEPFGVIESVKATNDLYSPVSGEVVEVNEALQDEPGRVNEDPYGEGWMVVIKMTNPGEIDSLTSADEYRAQVGGENA
ncbi:MAG: glycine cleavage system protein GcvH [Dehalococcoidia bacterium]|nr:glycine cleavage system protein GcvH [Dehalococcoidia bacterium]MBL7165516.1 glycine cleavage system protein GcvH [Dehalococcoidales bacterium]